METFQEFEREWSKWTGCDHVVGCSSGTAALHLALEALQLPPKSKVIVPDFTMIACARAVTLAGLTPVFVDCSRDDMNIDPKQIENALWGNKDYRHTAAILAVHTYGRSCDMTSIHELASKYDLLVIEDMAEAHCGRPHPNTDAACWSFYKNKVVFGEEGGAIAFRHDLDETSSRARKLRSLGFTDQHDYWHLPRGHNYRLSNLHADAILDNLFHVDRLVACRRSQETVYDATIPQAYHLPSRETPWVYDLRIKELNPAQQTAIVSRLRAQGLEARHAFKPMSLQPEYGQGMTKGHDGAIEDLKLAKTLNAARFAREVIYLPLGQSLRMDSDRAAGIAAEVIKDVMGG